MASIQTRKPRRPGGPTTYCVRFRDPSGKDRSKTFGKKAQAQSFKATVEADKIRGTYVDQTLGKMTLGEYCEQWLAVQTYGHSTREQTSHRVRRYIISLARLDPAGCASYIADSSLGSGQAAAVGAVDGAGHFLSSVVDAERGRRR